MDIRIKMLLLRPFFLISPCTPVQGNADSYSLLQYTNWLTVLFVCFDSQAYSHLCFGKVARPVTLPAVAV